MNSNRLLIAQLNVSSLRNKFTSLSTMIKNNVDILLISKTKTESSFPTAQFHIDGYSICRRDRNENGGGLLLYIRDDLPLTLLKIDPNFEAFYVELNIRKRKSLLCCSYNPNKNLINKHLDESSRNLDLLSSKYDNFILLGDFNSELCEQPMRDFFHVYNCQNIIKEKTCFKNPHHPSCVDLIITNRPKSFQNSTVIETCLSNFHKMPLTALKIFYKKQHLNIVIYRNYRNFDNELFMNDVKKSIPQEYVKINFYSLKLLTGRLIVFLRNMLL